MAEAGLNPNITLANATTIDNVALLLANTEYAYVFPNSTRKFSIKGRTPGTIKLAFASGQSSVKYFTIPPSGYYAEDGLDLSGVTVYLQSDKPALVVEMLSWQQI